ncbi:MAG: nickel pincer cofactor biosynthesis protein LarB [Deltaproteobacteria bacterium]|nr:nickel pincer cofactor biosynthesis protein LarB [Deltaproteobacteria bacterium]
MSPEKLKSLLFKFKNNELSEDEIIEHLAKLPFADLGHSTIDHHRNIRTGFPEVVYGEGKSAKQISQIVKELSTQNEHILVTRVDFEKAAEVVKLVPSIEFHIDSGCLTLSHGEIIKRGVGPIAVVTAGTSDLKVAREAALTARISGNEVIEINDVGVAGVHRLFHRLDDLRRATVLIVVAGMEGALPSVIGGLVSAPVIAVPTSVGYGVNFGGVAALLGMLTSCSSGITVVNIDNGFGAGYAAAQMNRIGETAHAVKR